MIKKIVIAGGTGFIGKHLKAYYTKIGYNVLIISRQKNTILWENDTEIIAALENAEICINLAGKSVDCRYNKKNREAILASRVETTKIIGDAIKSCKNPPPLWINSSTATIYRHAQDRPMTENTGEIGSGFSVNVATSWEKAFFNFKLSNTRQVALRMAIVLGKNGGVIVPLKKMVQLYFGGKQGDGKQMFSWVHIDDVISIIEYIKQTKIIEGVINTTAPTPVTNYVFMQSFRKAMNIKWGLNAPKWLLKIGAYFINTETELILKSRWVLPEKLLLLGYQFKFAKIDDCLKNILVDNKS